MPSTQENNFLFENIVVQLNNKQLRINIYDTSLGQRFMEALKDNLDKKRVLEKNFCWLGWADSTRDLHYLVGELNKSIAQINSFNFDPAYEKIHPFSVDDFQYSANLPTGLTHDRPSMEKPGHGGPPLTSLISLFRRIEPLLLRIFSIASGGCSLMSPTCTWSPML